MLAQRFPRPIVSAFVALSLAGSCAPLNAQTTVPLGAGTYYSSTPPGQEVPSDNNNAPVAPRVVPGFIGAPPTNQWWSSIIWPRYAGNIYGTQMHPNPLSFQANGTGLGVALPRTPNVFGTGYSYEYNDQSRGLNIGVSGMTNGDLRVARAGDWSVTAQWTSPGKTFRATFGRGIPYVYAEVTGGNAQVSFNTVPGTPNVWSNSGNVIGVTIGGTAYGLFAPTGSTWTISNNVATSTLNGQTYYSVAALPEASPAALALFAQHAFAFVTDTRVSWAYDAANSCANVQFDFITMPKEGAETVPLIALFRHQWLYSTLPTTAYTYASARGEMKLATASSFVAKFPYRGVVPKLPDVGAISNAALYALVNQENQAANLNLANDTYGAGRSYGKVAQLLHIANDVGHTAAKSRFLTFLKDEIREWYFVGALGGGRSAYEPIQAESFDASQGVTVGAVPGGQGVLDFGGGDWVKYTGVNFGDSVPTRLLVQYASTTSGSGSFQVRIDSVNGPVIAGGGVGSTGGAWQEIALGMGPGAAGLAGIHDVYITMTTPYSGELCRFDSFRFDRAGAPSDRYFAYNTTWSTLIGYPASYGSAAELNDHHFHYGYFIYAAAAIAQYDPAWASQSQYGAMTKLLISDAANWDRTDTRFPFLRNYDVYSGHSQASGHAGFASGNNQESSSEAINFAAALILWGGATRDTTIRDLGIFLYASESAAIMQYWFDADNAVYPPNAPKKIAGIVWDSGTAYGTWFSGEPEHIHGINFLPVTTASLHLGTRPDAILKSYNIMTAARGGPPTLWQATHWSTLAMADPAAANALLTANPGYTPDGADSKAQMTQWIRTMGTVGVVDATVRADWPYYSVFLKASVKCYWAWNPTASPVTVHFSDGASLCVPACQMATSSSTMPGNACACPADFNVDGSTSVDDLFLYLNAWFTGDASADMDDQNGVAIDDLFLFLSAWFVGCP